MLQLLVYGAAALLLLTLAAVSFINTRNQTHSSVRINLAGRQRMLSQKLVKEVLIYRLGGHNRAGIENTVECLRHHAPCAHRRRTRPG